MGLTMEHFNGLTPAEDELLALILEECGEIVQAVGKIQRHGYESVDPTKPPEEQITNRRALQKELGDLKCAIHLMHRSGHIDWQTIDQAAVMKLQRIRRYLHHQPIDIFHPFTTTENV